MNPRNKPEYNLESSRLGPEFGILARIVRDLFDIELRKYLAKSQNQAVLDNYCELLYGHPSMAELKGDSLFRFLDNNNQTSCNYFCELSIQDIFDIDSLKKLRRRLRHRPFRDALIELVVAMHGMWVFVWNDQYSSFRFMRSSVRDDDQTDGRIWFGSGLCYNTAEAPFRRMFLKSLLDGYELRPGQGTVGLSLRAGCAVCLRNTIIDLRGSVPFEDEVIGNKSYCGIPIFPQGATAGSAGEEYPISHFGVFFPVPDAWHPGECSYEGGGECFMRFLEKFVRVNVAPLIRNAHDHIASLSFKNRFRRIASIQKEVERSSHNPDSAWDRATILDGLVSDAGDKVSQDTWSTNLISCISLWEAGERSNRLPKGFVAIRPASALKKGLKRDAGYVFSKLQSQLTVKGSHWAILNQISAEAFQDSGAWALLAGWSKDNGYAWISLPSEQVFDAQYYLLAMAKKTMIDGIKEELPGLLQEYLDTSAKLSEGGYQQRIRECLDIDQAYGLIELCIEYEKHRLTKTDYLMRLLWRVLNAKSEDINVDGKFLANDICCKQITNLLSQLAKFRGVVKGIWLLEKDQYVWKANANNTSDIPIRVLQELGIENNSLRQSRKSSLAYSLGTRVTLSRLVKAIMMDDECIEACVHTVKHSNPRKPVDCSLSKKPRRVRTVLRSELTGIKAGEIVCLGAQTALSVPEMASNWNPICREQGCYEKVIIKRTPGKIVVKITSDSKLELGDVEFSLIESRSESNELTATYIPLTSLISEDIFQGGNGEERYWLKSTLTSDSKDFRDDVAHAAKEVLEAIKNIPDNPEYFPMLTIISNGDKRLIPQNEQQLSDCQQKRGLATSVEKLLDCSFGSNGGYPGLLSLGFSQHYLVPIYYDKEVVAFCLFSDTRIEHDFHDRLLFGPDAEHNYLYAAEQMEIGINGELAQKSVIGTLQGFAHSLKRKDIASRLLYTIVENYKGLINSIDNDMTIFQNMVYRYLPNSDWLRDMFYAVDKSLEFSLWFKIYRLIMDTLSDCLAGKPETALVSWKDEFPECPDFKNYVKTVVSIIIKQELGTEANLFQVLYKEESNAQDQEVNIIPPGTIFLLFDEIIHNAVKHAEPKSTRKLNIIFINNHILDIELTNIIKLTPVQDSTKSGIKLLKKLLNANFVRNSWDLESKPIKNNTTWLTKVSIDYNKYLLINEGDHQQ